MRSEGYGSWVCVSVCLSVKSHLTSGVSAHPENTVTYSAGNGGQKICVFFSETAPLQRSSTAPLKAIRMVGHFPAEITHVHSTEGSSCTLVHSFSKMTAEVAMLCCIVFNGGC